MSFYFTSIGQLLLFASISALIVVSALGNLALRNLGPYFEHLIQQDPAGVQAKIASVKAMHPVVRWSSGIAVDIVSNCFIFWPAWVSYRIVAEAAMEDEYVGNLLEQASLRSAISVQGDPAI